MIVPAAPARAHGLSYVTSFGSFGSGSGQFSEPAGVAASGGLVYVADQLNNRIDRFDPTNFAASFTAFGSPDSEQFTEPTAVAVSGGLVDVADTFNNRIAQLAPVPEASPLALAAAGGLAMLIPWRIRRGAKRAA
jgi:hypothetical protein